MRECAQVVPAPSAEIHAFVLSLVFSPPCFSRRKRQLYVFISSRLFPALVFNQSVNKRREARISADTMKPLEAEHQSFQNVVVRTYHKLSNFNPLPLPPGEAHKPFLAVGNEPANRRLDDAGRTRGGSRSVAAAAAVEKQQVGLARAARGGRALPAPAAKAARCGLYPLRRLLLLWSYARWQQRSDADASQY